MPLGQVDSHNLPTRGSSGTLNQLGGPFGECLGADLYGPWAMLCANGMVWSGCCVATGLALPIYTSTTGAFALWNPYGSGVNVMVIDYTAAYVSGTGVVSGFGFNYLANAGSQISTVGPLPTGTEITTTIGNGLIGGASGKTRQAKLLSAFTSTATPTSFKSMGMGQGAPVSAGTSVWSTPSFQFNGSLTLGPGGLVLPVGTAASGDLWWQSFTWAEVPF